MNQKYPVKLSETERSQLKQLVSTVITTYTIYKWKNTIK